jgi:hypothetical protein
MTSSLGRGSNPHNHFERATRILRYNGNIKEKGSFFGKNRLEQ